MNCIEALEYRIKECEPCRINSLIIEFEVLPEEEKINFDWYQKEKHILLYCQKCNLYKLLE
jgi:hypothetical protein